MKKSVLVAKIIESDSVLDSSREDPPSQLLLLTITGLLQAQDDLQAIGESIKMSNKLNSFHHY